jgi:hypothetical protein
VVTEHLDEMVFESLPSVVGAAKAEVCEALALLGQALTDLLQLATVCGDTLATVKLSVGGRDGEVVATLDRSLHPPR